MAFTELHARSAFSFLRGSSAPEELVDQAADLGMSHIAITDRDGVYGSARAHYKAKERGLRSIVGTELTMEDGGVQPVLVATRTGYQNLCKLITLAKLRSPKGQSRATWQELEAHAEGLIALGGDEESPLHQAMIQDPASASALINTLKRIFGRDRVFLELQRHRVRGETWRNQGMIELAERCGLPLIASNGACYATADRRPLHDAFTALRHHTHLDAAGLLLAANSQRHLKREKQMRALFPDLPHIIDNTQRVVDLIDYSLENLGYEFPSYAVPDGHSQEEFLRERAYAGARERYTLPLDDKVTKQLEHELGLIIKLGFSGYFLVVWDLVRYTTSQGILIQGRGSAANSVVCYCLKITNADPIRDKLLFERFLSEGRNGNDRKTWPDIDLDLPSGARRESIIQELYRRFAPYGAAMTANVITYRGRSAMREMSKVLNLPEDVSARFTDMYPHGDFPHTMELCEQLNKAGLPVKHPRLPALLNLFQMVKGLPRHLGQHCGGMVLCSQGLNTMVPLENAAMPNRKVVQWDKDDCEDLGIIKVDLLGLGMMAAIEDTMAICKQRGRPCDLDMPKDDPATFKMMQEADTIGVFQIESRAQMATLPRMKPECFYDVVIEVAIIRPGPIVGKLVHPYLNRRSGKEKPDYIDPRFEDTLKRTLGVPLFQEQVLKMAMVIADFTGSEAEELRRAMSFHRSEERMIKVVAKLRAGMQRKEVTEETQDRVVAAIQSFALYGFPESHAISFAILAYASVWMKVHRAVEFYAALLNNQPMGFYSSATLVRDARTHGLKIKPVCIVQSDVLCTVESDAELRLGFNQLNGINSLSQQRILAKRNARPWDSLNDFRQRCELAKAELRALARSGALNALGYHRRSALWEVEEAIEPDLFTPFACVKPSPLAAMLPLERLEADYKATSLTTGQHPMGYMRDQVPHLTPAAHLPLMRNGQHLFIGGQVICRQRPGTAKGHVFISLEDETGIANAFVHSKLFEAQRLVITQEPFLQIHGRLQLLDNVISLYAIKIEALHFDAALGSLSHDFH
ncbi:MAG: dnaE [Verrucomicrobiaceae bacterium]|nr:dnaE [Verrucomicrobiaceae bacterium]